MPRRRIFKIECHPARHPSLTSCFKYLQSMPRVQESLTPSLSSLPLSFFRLSCSLPFVDTSVHLALSLSFVHLSFFRCFSLSDPLFSLAFLSLPRISYLLDSSRSRSSSLSRVRFSALPPIAILLYLFLARPPCSLVECSSLLLDFGKAVSPNVKADLFRTRHVCNDIPVRFLQELATQRLCKLFAINIRIRKSWKNCFDGYREFTITRKSRLFSLDPIARA